MGDLPPTSYLLPPTAERARRTRPAYRLEELGLR